MPSPGTVFVAEPSAKTTFVIAPVPGVVFGVSVAVSFGLIVFDASPVAGGTLMVTSSLPVAVRPLASVTVYDCSVTLPE